MKSHIGLIAIMLVAAGCSREESRDARIARFKAEAVVSQRQRCTNMVTGLRSIISARIDESSGNPCQWTGSAVVEFINPVGGVERTNLTFFCRQYGGYDSVSHITAFVDETTFLKAAYDAAYEAGKRQAETRIR